MSYASLTESQYQQVLDGLDAEWIANGEVYGEYVPEDGRRARPVCLVDGLPAERRIRVIFQDTMGIGAVKASRVEVLH